MEIARHWRLKEQRYRLIGEECDHCNAAIFPPRDICPHCRNEAKGKKRFSGKGEVFSYTTVFEAPEGHQHNAPYTLALIKLAEGPMVTAQLTDLGEVPVEIGMLVEMVTRKLTEEGDRGIIVYGYKFRPIMEGVIAGEHTP